MEVTVTRTFRFNEEAGTRKYTPGEVASGAAAEFALANGYCPKPPAKKAKPAPKNKAKTPAEGK